MPGANIEPQRIELILAQLESLPPLSPVVARILTLTEASTTNARQIVELIESDPSLTVRVLSLLNRAEHAVRRDVVSVKNAVVLLGFNVIRQAALAAKIMEVFGIAGSEPQPESPAFDRAEFWKHCLAVACAARRIAMSLRCGVEPEEAFVLGLLHDIGKIALDTVMPKSFARIVRRARDARGDIAQAERAMLGGDHTVVGRRLAERWRLPQPLIDCVWLHHQPPESLPASVAEKKHVQIVQLADTLVREQHIGFSGNHCVLTPSRVLAAGLGLKEEERLGIIKSLAEEIEARAVWIGAEQINSREVYLKALMQTADELACANIDLLKQNRRLERKAACFAALGWLNQAVSPRASVREVCGAAAEAFRRALSVRAAVVFVTSAKGNWVELGFSDGRVQSGAFERPAGSQIDAGEIETVVTLARSGTWLTPPGRSIDFIIDRCSVLVGQDGLWLMPALRERQWIGAAVFPADPELVLALREDTAELEALSGALGLAVAQAQVRAESLALTEELAEINRRWAAAQAELVQARAADAVVAMAAGAAHEMNNPLAVVSGRAQMLKGKTADDEMRAALDVIVKQAQVCSDIVTDLMELAEPRPPNPEGIDLRRFLDVVAAEWTKSGLLDVSALSLEIPSDTPRVRFDCEQLRDIFGELVRNAAAAMQPDSRRLTIKAFNDLTEEQVVVQVADNGRGMTPEVLARAVDPFYSHRPAGRGRGLGLARARRWAQLNGGSIRIQSEPGRGTTVELRLPALRE